VKRHLAQLNVATLRHPIDDPRIADFADALPVVNGAGEQSAGTCGDCNPMEAMQPTSRSSTIR
jgi:hypothetical protein